VCVTEVHACALTLVTDTTPPVFAGVGGAQSIQCGAALQFSSPAVSDACDAHPSFTFADVTTPGSCAQSYDVTRTWTARDACGNQSTASQIIHVTDTTPPVIAGADDPPTTQCQNALRVRAPAARAAYDEQPPVTPPHAAT